MLSTPVTAVSRRIPGTPPGAGRRRPRRRRPSPCPAWTRPGCSRSQRSPHRRAALGPQIADYPSISAADDEPDGRQDGGRAGVDVTDGNAHGLGDPVVPGSRLERARDRPAREHVFRDAASNRLEQHVSGVDGPLALPVSGATNGWLCHVRLPPGHCLPDRPQRRDRGFRRLAHDQAPTGRRLGTSAQSTHLAQSVRRTKASAAPGLVTSCRSQRRCSSGRDDDAYVTARQTAIVLWILPLRMPLTGVGSPVWMRTMCLTWVELSGLEPLTSCMP